MYQDTETEFKKYTLKKCTSPVLIHKGLKWASNLYLVLQLYINTVLHNSERKTDKKLTKKIPLQTGRQIFMKMHFPFFSSSMGKISISCKFCTISKAKFELTIID